MNNKLSFRKSQQRRTVMTRQNRQYDYMWCFSLCCSSPKPLAPVVFFFFLLLYCSHLPLPSLSLDALRRLPSQPLTPYRHSFSPFPTRSLLPTLSCLPSSSATVLIFLSGKGAPKTRIHITTAPLLSVQLWLKTLLNMEQFREKASTVENAREAFSYQMIWEGRVWLPEPLDTSWARYTG